MILSCDEWGDADAPPVVCLHGITATRAVYRRFAAEHLPDRRVVAPDLRGHGRSGAEPPWRVETHVADVLETMAAAGIERAALVGHSFGGRVAWEVAAARPDAAERLVLLDPAFGLAPARLHGLAGEWGASRPLASVEEAKAEWRETVALAADDLLTEVVMDGLEPADGGWRWRFDPTAIRASIGDLAVPPSGAAHVPALLVLGADSELNTPGLRAFFEDACGERLRTVTVPGGHSVLLDAPAETGAAVREFLEAPASTPSTRPVVPE